MALRVKDVVLGNPVSPRHQINPLQLSQLLEEIQGSVSTGTNLFFEDTLADLNAVAGATTGDTGFVLDDGASTGTYRYSGSAWALTASLPPGLTNPYDGLSGLALLKQSWRPGENPENFTKTRTGEVADSEDVEGVVVTSTDGKELQLTGARVIATRERIHLDSDYKYSLKFSYYRQTNPTDPAGDTVRLGIYWLDQTKSLISGGNQVLRQPTLTVADGLQVDEYLVNDPSSAIEIPEGAVYMVPYIQTFGLDGVTRIRELKWEQSQDKKLVQRVPRTFYVTMEGSDDNAGQSLSDPLATIEKALQKMAALAPLSCVAIVQPGEYLVPPDTLIPANCALYGYDLRVTKLILANAAGDAQAAGAERQNNMFLMNSGIKVRGFTFTGLEHDSFTFDPITQTYAPPTKGWAFAFNPGAVITRSPYIADCSGLHDFTQDEMTLPIDRTDGNAEFTAIAGRGQGNILADGSVLDPDSPLRSVVVDSFTAINPNGVAYAITRNAFVQLVSVFTNWSRVGLWSHEGGQVTVANSNNTFGDYALAATGFRRAVLIPDTPAGSLSEQDAAAAIIDGNFEAIVTDIMARYQTIPDWSASYDTLAERDTRTMLKAIANDLRSGQDRAIQYFTKGFFDWNADFAFNSAVAPIFITSWDQVEAELYERIANATARAMITTLINIPQAVFTDIIANGDASTYVAKYPSVIEATGQQFSYAGSGINYNSLPFSQRGTGDAPDPSSTIIKYNGGRVYATFSTEVGDTYLGEDLRVDFERSTIEGQAFSRGVQNISLPLTVALGG